MVEGEGAEEVEEEVSEEVLMPTMTVSVLVRAGIVVKMDTWLSNVKNPEEKEKTQEVL